MGEEQWMAVLEWFGSGVVYLEHVMADLEWFGSGVVWEWYGIPVTHNPGSGYTTL